MIQQMLSSILKTICIVLISSIVTYFLIGLVEYKEKILISIKHIGKKSSDIVILTGGTNRIKDGLKIVNKFEESSTFNSKILVSGTGKGFTKMSLAKNIDFDFNLIECCIELDSISTNTYSNAFETLKWVKKNNISEFILITSNYHMPRAFLEFKYRMPNLKIFTYPITPEKHNINMWLSSCLLYTSPSPRDLRASRMPSSA